MKLSYRFFCTAVLFAVAQFLFSQGAENSLDFDNSNSSYVEVADKTTLQPANFTLEAWFKIEATTGNQQVILSKQYGTSSANSFALYCFHNNGAYNLRFYGFGSSVHIWSDNFALGVWHHAAATYDGATVYLYLNGIQVASAAQESPPEYDSNPVLIGADNDDSDNNYEYLFNGEIDEVRIWKVARTASEIRNNMNKTLSGTESDLEAYWNFDSGSGTTLVDQTSNNNDGILAGGSNPTWVTSAAKVGDESIFSFANSDISRKAGCMVDVDLSDEGISYSYSVYQVNSTPNTTNDLLSYVANKYWEIDASDADFDGDFSAVVDFHFDEIGGIADESNLKLFRRNDAEASTWTEVTATLDDEGNNSDGNGYLRLSLDESSSGDFSGQYIITSSDNDNETLPVELLSFVAEQQNRDVIISWSTASETNNDYFVVERSTDGINWENIQKTKSYANSNTIKNYSNIDRPLQNSKRIFYRLKQVDIDGRVTIFKPVAVEYKISETIINYYQDSEFINIEIAPAGNEFIIDVIDLNGNLKARKVSSRDFIRINTSQFSSGIYFLHISDGFGFNKTCKVFIE